MADDGALVRLTPAAQVRPLTASSLNAKYSLADVDSTDAIAPRNLPQHRPHQVDPVTWVPTVPIATEERRTKFTVCLGSTL